MSGLRVNINGIEYEPKTNSYRLTDEHFEAAKLYENAFEMIHWAHDTQASVAEMRAWGSAKLKEEEPEPAKLATKKSGKTLFAK